MLWYENKPEDLEIVMKDGTTYDVIYMQYIPAYKSVIFGKEGTTYPENRLVFYKKNKDDIVPDRYGGFNDMGWRDECIVRVKKQEESKIDWSKPLEVKIWGIEDYNTRGWVDAEVDLDNDLWKNVSYLTKYGANHDWYATLDGNIKRKGTLIGKVRNKTPFATLKDSNGKEVKVPKGTITETGTIKEKSFHADAIESELKNLKDWQMVHKLLFEKPRKNNIVIEKFPDKVVVKEINLMSAADIYYKYGTDAHSKYFATNLQRCMYFDQGIFKLYKYGIVEDMEFRRIHINQEFSLTEWDKIWFDIKECGKRLSTIIRANKRPEQGKEEILYV